MRRIVYIQQLPISLEEAWDFFSNPINLLSITPQDFKLTPLHEIEEKVYPGMYISYKVQPFPGVALTWITEITQVRAKEYFVDNQPLGPFKIWHHEHHFSAIDGGVEMKDILTYVAPFGFLGKFADWLFLSKKVDSIFLFRKEILEKKFGKINK